MLIFNKIKKFIFDKIRELWCSNKIIYYTKNNGVNYTDRYYYTDLLVAKIVSSTILHRLDGPAVIYSKKRKEYWINDKELDTQDVEDWIKENNINLKTKAHQALFMLMFG